MTGLLLILAACAGGIAWVTTQLAVDCNDAIELKKATIILIMFCSIMLLCGMLATCVAIIESIGAHP